MYICGYAVSWVVVCYKTEELNEVGDARLVPFHQVKVEVALCHICS